MQKYRPMLVFLLTVSLLLTNLSFNIHANTKNENEVLGSLIQSNTSFSLMSDFAFSKKAQTRIPPFMVWTSLSQRDIEACLPRGGTAQQQHDGGYLISGVTDALEFGVNLGIKSTERRADAPRIGKQGTQDPKTIPAHVINLANKMAQVLHNIIYAPRAPRKQPPGPIDPFPKGPIPETEKLQQGFIPGFDPNGEPPVVGGGKWVAFCEPKAPCDRPAEPFPEDVDDCKKEQDEVDYLTDKVNYYADFIKITEDALTALDAMEALADSGEYIYLTFAAYAVITCPIGAGPGLVLVVGGITVMKVLKAIFDATKIAATRLVLKQQLADFKRYYNSYLNGLRDALAELRACRKKAAEAAGRNTAAFQKFINVDLPAYYDCLKRRKCGRRWVPK